ncbi:MAG: glycosyltransferase family 2 protein [Candidatus Micrarchaeia archaeon]
MDLWVVIPTKNEEENIGGVIDAVPKSELLKLGIETRILVVDGKSTDRTVEIAKSRGADVIVQSGYGKGGAIREAFELLRKRRCDIVVMVDGDFTYNPMDIPYLILPLLIDRADVVIGTRRLSAGSMGAVGRFGNALLTLLARIAVRQTQDLCSGFWALNKKALCQMNITADSFDLEADMLVETRKQNLRVGSVPITYSKRPGGSSKLNPLIDGGVIAFRILRRIRDWNPLAMFCTISVFFLLIAFALGYELFVEFIKNGAITKVPRMIVVMSFVIISFLLFQAGLLLDYFEKK